jgi:hypothetical protein
MDPLSTLIMLPSGVDGLDLRTHTRCMRLGAKFRISSSLVFPVLSAIVWLLGTQQLLSTAQASEAPRPPFGPTIHHVPPFPFRFLLDVSVLSAGGIVTFVLLVWAVVQERERVGKYLTLFVALCLVPCALISSVAFHEYVIGVCDAQYHCDAALGQWEDAPGFFHFLAAELLCWVVLLWFVDLPVRRMRHAPWLSE